MKKYLLMISILLSTAAFAFDREMVTVSCPSITPQLKDVQISIYMKNNWATVNSLQFETKKMIKRPIFEVLNEKGIQSLDIKMIDEEVHEVAGFSDYEMEAEFEAVGITDHYTLTTRQVGEIIPTHFDIIENKVTNKTKVLFWNSYYSPEPVLLESCTIKH